MKDYQKCIEACLKCASACQHCAASCTRLDDVNMMATCIRNDMECAALCYAAAQLMSLGSDKATEVCKICAELCEKCGAECAKHDHAHCKACAEACRICADECRKMAA